MECVCFMLKPSSFTIILYHINVNSLCLTALHVYILNKTSVTSLLQLALHCFSLPSGAHVRVTSHAVQFCCSDVELALYQRHIGGATSNASLKFGRRFDVYEDIVDVMTRNSTAAFEMLEETDLIRKNFIQLKVQFPVSNHVVFLSYCTHEHSRALVKLMSIGLMRHLSYFMSYLQGKGQFIYTDVASMGLEVLIGTLGGILNLWIGVTFITVVELVDLVIKITAYLHSKRLHKKPFPGNKITDGNVS